MLPLTRQFDYLLTHEVTLDNQVAYIKYEYDSPLITRKKTSKLCSQLVLYNSS